MSQFLDSKPWIIYKNVLPQDSDHAGVMWHGSYLSWLEEGRIFALEKVGLPYHKLSFGGFEMPVTSLQISYLKPLFHGDKVVLESKCLPREGVRWTWLTSFFKNDSIKVAEAKVDLVLVSNHENNFRIIRHIPDHFSLMLEKLQEGPMPSEK